MGKPLKVPVLTTLLCGFILVPLYISMFIPNSTERVLKNYLLTSIYGNSSDVHDESMVYIWATYVALISPGSLIGALFTPYLVDSIGRKRTLLLLSCVEIPTSLIASTRELCALSLVCHWVSVSVSEYPPRSSVVARVSHVRKARSGVRSWMRINFFFVDAQCQLN